MKKLLSIVLCLLMALSVLPAGAENPSVLDQMWMMADFSFLADWGILTEAEVALLSPDRDVVENGRELVREFTLDVGPLTGVPEEDAAFNALLGRMTFINRSRRHEESLEVLLDGETLLTLGYGEGEEGYRISSNLLDEVIAFTATDLETLPNRLVTAAQNNCLVTREEAMQFGLMTAQWPSSTYGTLLRMLSGDLSVYADPDLTAWNAVMTSVQGRCMYTAVTEQPTDCDPAVEVWTLTVTGADVTNLVRAALITLQDNPDAALALSEAMGLQDMGDLYGMSGNVLLDLVVTPALAELEGVEEMLSVQIQLTAWENVAGEIVRMEIVVLDTEADVPTVVLRADYIRLTDGDTVTHDVVLGDDWGDYIYATFVAGPGSFTFDIGEVYMEGEADQAYADGGRSSEFCCTLAWDVQRHDGVTALNVEFTNVTPVKNWDEETWEYVPTGEMLGMSIRMEAVLSETEFIFRMQGDNRQYYYHNATDMEVHYRMDGADLTGTERFTFTTDGVTLLAYNANVRTREPSGSIMDGEAIHLSALTDDELTAWVAGVLENVEAWLDNDVVHYFEERLAEPEVDDGEVAGELTGMMFICSEEAGQSFTWTLTADDVVAVDEEYADGTLKLHFTGLQPGEVMLNVMIMNADGVVVRASQMYLSVDVDGVVHLKDIMHLTEFDGVPFN